MDTGVFVLWLAAGNLLAQCGPQVGDTKHVAALDAQREEWTVQALLQIAEKSIIPAVDAVQTDKFGFTPGRWSCSYGGMRLCYRGLSQLVVALAAWQADR